MNRCLFLTIQQCAAMCNVNFTQPIKTVLLNCMPYDKCKSIKELFILYKYKFILLKEIMEFPGILKARVNKIQTACISTVNVFELKFSSTHIKCISERISFSVKCS